MRTAHLDYHLPPERIAVAPVTPRDAARLMVVRRAAHRIEHHHVCDLPEIRDLIRPGDVMVFNHTRVIPAWFEGIRLGTGGRVTGLYVRSAAEDQWIVMLESRGTLQAGEVIGLVTTDSERPVAELHLIESLDGGSWRAAVIGGAGALSLLEHVGKPPLPPYIRKARRAADLPEFTDEDEQRYNTVFGDEAGSVAAPTAALHFTDELLARLDTLGVHRIPVTLHIGLGTFMPVRVDDLADHEMHEEWIDVPASSIAALRAARAEGRRIIAVGTTVVRTLESLPDPLPDADDGFRASTNLFITPPDPQTDEGGFDFRFTDLLMTNFHLPRSTLIALVAALPNVGVERLKQWYAEAIERQYRFYSYGDAMLLTP